MAAELLSKMHDIEGLDQIGIWPLAIGWWLIIFSIVLTLVCLMFFYVRRKNYKNSWLYIAYNDLVALENSLTAQSNKYVVTELSLLLRQIAVKKYPREVCASVSGTAWLVWLTAHDPKQFNWLKYGQMLVLGPYRQNLSGLENTDLIVLINAAKRWVR